MPYSWGRSFKVSMGLLLAACCAAIPATANVSQAQEPSGGQAKNVILFIGDGMGPAQREAIRLSSVGVDGQLAMDSLPYSGDSQTSSRDPETFITDSAAGGTAIATGVKTYNGAVGVDVDGEPVESVLESAGQAGRATGVVTDSQATDATPASFAAHAEDRDDQSEIARQFVEETRPDVILGGGEDYWYPEGNPGAYPDPSGDPEEGSMGTRGNLVEQARQEGYAYVTNGDELAAAEGQKLLGLFANETMFEAAPEGEGAEYDPVVPLSQMTEKAIGTLSGDPDGFFLMVEGEGIDEMAHQSNAPLMMKAGRALDEAVGVAKSYAQSHPDTLVLVAADHATGGLAIEDVNALQDDPDYPNESGEGRTSEDGPFAVAGSPDYEYLVDWTTANHTATSVPVTAGGPGASRFAGVYENTHLHDAMLASMGLPEADALTMPQTGGMSLGDIGGATSMVVLLVAGALCGGGSLIFLRSRRSRRS